MAWRTQNLYNEELNGLSNVDWFKNGYAFLKTGNHKQVIEAFSKGIELDPNCAEAYFCRGIAYAQLGNYQQAIKDFNRAIELNPKYAMAYNNRGVAYGELGDYRQAIRDYDRAIELDPNDAGAYNNRGTAYVLGPASFRLHFQDYFDPIGFFPRKIGVRPGVTRPSIPTKIPIRVDGPALLL